MQLTIKPLPLILNPNFVPVNNGMKAGAMKEPKTSHQWTRGVLVRKVFSKVFAQNKALRTQESVFLISKYEEKKTFMGRGWKFYNFQKMSRSLMLSQPNKDLRVFSKKRKKNAKLLLLLFFGFYIKHSHWWRHKFSNMVSQKATLFILHSHFTKHSISVVLF